MPIQVPNPNPIQRPKGKRAKPPKRFAPRDVVAAFKRACRTNFFTLWRPPEKFLAPCACKLTEPFRFQVTVPGAGRVNIAPGAVFAFDVKGSASRLCMLEIDDGKMPIEDERFRQTSLWRKLVCYRHSDKDIVDQRFRSRIFILILVPGKERVNHLWQLIESELQTPWQLFYLADIGQMETVPDALAIRWLHRNSDPPQSSDGDRFSRNVALHGVLIFEFSRLWPSDYAHGRDFVADHVVVGNSHFCSLWQLGSCSVQSIVSFGKRISEFRI